jgi:hypothetical protein
LGTGASLAAVCQSLVDAGDRDGFAAIRRFAPYWLLARERELPAAEYQRLYGNWSQLVREYESKLLTPDERAAAEIVATLDRNGGMQRANFDAAIAYLVREGTSLGLQGGNMLPRLVAWSPKSGQGGILAINDDQLQLVRRDNVAPSFGGYPLDADLPALAEFGR